MEATLVSALSGVRGSLVGGSTTVTTAWITPNTLHKRELLREQIQTREALYGEFIDECAKLLMDAFVHTLEKPETMLRAYARVNRVRLSASPAVLAEAENLLKRIAEQYFPGNATLEELRALTLSRNADPMKACGEACRGEIKSTRGLV